MKINKLYSNRPDIFKEIIFKENKLNIIYADVDNLKENNKHTHNLGKSLLVEILDFMFLKKRNNDSLFMFKNYSTFSSFVFFLEIKIENQSYITIRRGVNRNSKISIKKTKTNNNNFVNVPVSEWDHAEIDIKNATNLLNGLFKFTVFKNSQIDDWSFRKSISYFLRRQNDYQEVFQLSKFRGKHKSWKPYLFHVLGFNGQILLDRYKIEEIIEKKQQEIKLLQKEYKKYSGSQDKIKQMAKISETKIVEQEKQLDKFNFAFKDNKTQEDLVYSIEQEIAFLNDQKYALAHEKKDLEERLKEKIEFDLEEIETIFKEASIYFSGQLKKDYNDLLNFNKAMRSDRLPLFKKQLQKVNKELAIIDEGLLQLNIKREEYIDFLENADILGKYKSAQAQLVQEKTNLAVLKERLAASEKINKINLEIASLKIECSKLTTEIESSISDGSETYENIKTTFSDIIKEVLDQDAIIFIRTNNNDNVDFKAEFLNPDGMQTSKNKGNSYRRLLCVAFDLAVLMTYSKKRFFKFTFHDGVLEGLDDRVKIKLIEFARSRCEIDGIQYIFTMISSDMPAFSQDLICKEDEIIKKLHDKGQDGRLFQMEEF